MARFDNFASAISFLLSHTNWDNYQEASDFVCDVWNSALENKPQPTLTPDDLDFIRGSKIQAIKKLREFTGLGLKEAKDFVEAVYCSAPNTNDDRINNLEWDIQFTKNLVAYRDNTIEQQQETIRKLRSLLHSLVDKM